MLTPLSAVDLGAVVVRAVLGRVHLPGSAVDQVIMGTVVTAGLDRFRTTGVARAGIPAEVPALSINKVCASSLKACTLAAALIRAGEAEIVVAGDMESMSNAPYLLDQARWGYRMGNGELRDAMIVDGLWCPTNRVHMGIYGGTGARDFRSAAKNRISLRCVASSAMLVPWPRAASRRRSCRLRCLRPEGPL